MGKKNTAVQTATGTAPAPSTRTPKALTPAAQELLDKAKKEVATKREEMNQSKQLVKEAKALGKLIVCVSTLGVWALVQLKTAIGVREKELAPKDDSADRL